MPEIEKQECPNCGYEMDFISKELIQLRNEDMWIAHSEEMFKRGYRPSKLERLPEYMRKSSRIIKYYEKLEKRIEKRNKAFKENITA